MKYGEAIDLLDDVPREAGSSVYSKKTMKSESRDKWVVKSAYGLCRCTHDWPAPYSPSKEDMEATDWIIEND